MTASERSADSEHREVSLGQERPWLSAASYWTPRVFVLSAWLEHASFAFWLVDAIRPRRYVELGTHLGFSFFTVSEAVARAGSNTECFAIDSWQGDEHAGFYGDEIFDGVAATTAEHYSRTTTLVRSRFSDAVDRFEDASIDLILIDGRHRYEDAKADFETYLPKLTDDAVVLFHDTRERANGFGVWRLWEELEAAHPDRTFEFHHEHGLGVLALGPRAGTRLEGFFRAGRTDGDAIREDYSALGHRVAEAFQERETIRKQSDRIRELERMSAELEERLTDAQDAIEAMRSSRSWKLTAPIRRVSALAERSSG
ncbi:class I SAM-dependent methyltransferase [Plantibacter sp. YIM 135347]|uniref:class I SAM-dependent methyltransferase n=1 Tax=Plantibacter sp. YIM 135347 TaxID=3423919 RepID=UPI003D34AC75